MGRIPSRDLREAEPFNAFFFAPAVAPGFSLSSLFSTHPPLEKRLDQLGADLRRARPSAPDVGLTGDAVLGRSKPTEAEPGPAVRAARRRADPARRRSALRPTGRGAVCFRAAEGAALSRACTDDLQALLDADGGPAVERSVDAFGFTWLLVRHDPDDLPGAGHRAARGQRHAAGRRVRPVAAVLAGRRSTHSGDRRGWAWSTSTSGARSTRSPRPTASSATTRSSCRSARRSAPTCPSSPTSPAGSPSGARPASDPRPGELRPGSRTAPRCRPDRSPRPRAAPRA